MPNSPRATTSTAELPAENEGVLNSERSTRAGLPAAPLARSTATKTASTITPISSAVNPTLTGASTDHVTGPMLTSDVGDNHPARGASTNPKTSAASPTNNSVWPSGSAPSAFSRPGIAGIVRSTPNTTTTASGRLIRNAEGQPNQSTSADPTSGPSAAAVPMVAP